MSDLYDWLAQPHPRLTYMAFYCLLFAILGYVKAIHKQLEEKEEE